jgi:hypothetical protein
MMNQQEKLVEEAERARLLSERILEIYIWVILLPIAWGAFFCSSLYYMLMTAGK